MQKDASSSLTRTFYFDNILYFMTGHETAAIQMKHCVKISIEAGSVV